MNLAPVLDTPIPTPFDNEAAGRDTWTVVFVLGADVVAADRRAALDRFALPAAFVERDGLPLMVSLASPGAMDDALALAVQALREALGDDLRVDEVRMLSHADSERTLADPAPVTYYGVTECARALGVSRQRVSQLYAEDKLPPPDAISGEKPLWDSARFESFASHRREQIRTTPQGRDPRTDSGSSSER